MSGYSFEDLALRAAQDFPNPQHVATDCDAPTDLSDLVQTTLLAQRWEGGRE